MIRTIEYNPTPRPVRVAPRPEQLIARDAIRAEVRLRFAKIDGLRAEGMPLLSAVQRVGLPNGAWSLIGAKVPDAMWVRWTPRDTTARGHEARAHVTMDLVETICGQRIPSKSTHYVDFRPGNPCKMCTRAPIMVAQRMIRQYRRGGDGHV